MKKLICILFTFLYVVLLLSGCSSGSQVPVESNELSSSSEVHSVESTEVPSEDETPSSVESTEKEESSQEDSPGIEIVYPLTEEPVTLTMWSEEPNLGPLRAFGGDYGVDIFEDYSSIQYVNELTNVYVSFENASSENAATLFNLHVASGDWADMIANADLYYAGGSGRAYSDGVLMDISKYMEYCSPNYNAIMDTDDAVRRASANEEGNVIQFCSLLGSFMQAEGTIIRQDWLDMVDMDIPTTIDELHTVLKAFQSEIGCVNPFYMNSACNQLLTSYNLVYYQELSAGDMGIYQIDGTVHSNFTSDTYRDWLNNLSTWYAEGLIDPDFISVSSSTFGGHDEELLAADNIGVWWGNINSMTNYFAICPADNFDITPTFIYATDEKANHTTSTSSVFGGGVSLSTTCSEPELACQWIDYWYSDEGIMLLNYGIEGESYEMVNGEIQYTDVIMNSPFGIDSAVALKLYSIAGCSFGVQLDERTFPFYIDCQMEAVETWTTPCDGMWAYPSVTLTTQESDKIGALAPDISTYIAENVPRFIMGEQTVEQNWDTFVSTVEDMGIGICIEIYQDALDRYNAA